MCLRRYRVRRTGYSLSVGPLRNSLPNVAGAICPSRAMVSTVREEIAESANNAPPFLPVIAHKLPAVPRPPVTADSTNAIANWEAYARKNKNATSEDRAYYADRPPLPASLYPIFRPRHMKGVASIRWPRPSASALVDCASPLGGRTRIRISPTPPIFDGEACGGRSPLCERRRSFCPPPAYCAVWDSGGIQTRHSFPGQCQGEIWTARHAGTQTAAHKSTGLKRTVPTPGRPSPISPTSPYAVAKTDEISTATS